MGKTMGYPVFSMQYPHGAGGIYKECGEKHINQSVFQIWLLLPM